MADLKIFAKTVEPEVIEQVNLLLAQPAFQDCKVRIMPDTHSGKGCVIGFTADLGDKVIPNVVGVDIGCGMLTVCIGRLTDIREWFDLEKLDRIIREHVPFGMNTHEHEMHYAGIDGLKCYKSLRNIERLHRSLGSLGGGNHFIEVDKDDDGYWYLVIHSGSRNLGKQVAEYYQNLAHETLSGKANIEQEITNLIKTLKTEGREREIQDKVKALKIDYANRETSVPKDLCYLTGEQREDYLHDMKICQEFAVANRKAMAEIISKQFGHKFDANTSFETIHNYIDMDTNIVRKGAIDASSGKLLLIPINMRDGCILGVGKGNEDWNNSAPHGAGRLMSRTKARATLSMDEYSDSMNGIFTTSVSADTIDEAPMAYKPMDEIVEGIRDTVDILRIIKPVYNFKASE